MTGHASKVPALPGLKQRVYDQVHLYTKLGDVRWRCVTYLRLSYSLSGLVCHRGCSVTLSTTEPTQSWRRAMASSILSTAERVQAVSGLRTNSATNMASPPIPTQTLKLTFCCGYAIFAFRICSTDWPHDHDHPSRTKASTHQIV